MANSVGALHGREKKLKSGHLSSVGGRGVSAAVTWEVNGSPCALIGMGVLDSLRLAQAAAGLYSSRALIKDEPELRNHITCTAP